MSLPFTFDTRFLTEESIGDGNGLSRAEIDRFRTRGARCLREMRKSKKEGRLPHYARDRKIRSTIREITSHADRLRKGAESLVIVGIGGSTAGTRAILEALLPAHWNELTKEQRGDRPKVYYIDNVEPDALIETLNVIDLKKAVVCYVSKSGSTAEVMANYAIVRERLQAADPEGWHKRTVVITDEKEGYLRREVEARSYRHLTFPEGLGGRWSVLSAVGLFPAAMIGLDISRMIDGATEVELLCTENDIDVNPALNAALHYYLMDQKKKKKVHVLFHYSTRLTAFGKWFQQLWAESLGKAYAHTGKEVHAGTLPVPSLGTSDQHSMLQFYLEGPDDKVTTFVSISRGANVVQIPTGSGGAGEPTWLFGRTMRDLIRYERIGTTYALASDSRPFVNLSINRLDEFSMGALFYFWELVVSYMATLYGVNAYDQPAVELGKWATQALMGDPEHQELKEEVISTLSLTEADLSGDDGQDEPARSAAATTPADDEADSEDDELSAVADSGSDDDDESESA